MIIITKIKFVIYEAMVMMMMMMMMIIIITIMITIIIIIATKSGNNLEVKRKIHTFTRIQYML
jgi:hypothetical protein